MGERPRASWIGVEKELKQPSKILSARHGAGKEKRKKGRKGACRTVSILSNNGKRTITIG
jgi:hypothetical protein